MMTAFELAAKLKLDSAEFSSALGKQESAFQKFGDKISKTTGLIQKVLGASAVAGAVMFTKQSISAGMEFDAAMSQVAATLGKTSAEMGELSAFARKMGAETAFSATEAAQALNYMALAGYDSEKSMKMLPSVLNLAAAGNFDLARASDMVTDAQSALGLSMEQTEKLVDQMAKTSSKTNTSVEQLGEGILTVGGTAKNLRGGTTELSALLGVLADNGIKGAEGGTALRNVLLSLSAPTDKASKVIKKLGIEVFDSKGKMKTMPSILEDINKATKDMTQQERTSVFNEIFNKRDLKAVEALLGTDMSRWQELWKDIKGAEGSAAQMAKTQLDNLKGDVTIMKSALSEAMISLSGKFTPALRTLTQFGTKAVQGITNAFNNNGLKGAVHEAGLQFQGFGLMLSRNTNPKIAKLGKAITTISKDFRRAKVEVKDFPSALTYMGKIITREIGNLKQFAKQGKVKIADFLGIEDAADASWYDIGKKVYDNVKNSVTTVANNAKVSLAKWLGLTDENGNPVDDASDVSWGNVAKGIVGNIKSKVKAFAADQKLKIADLLGIEEPENATWGTIAGEIVKRIKGGVGKAKLKIADLLGVEEPEEATWSDIAGKVVQRIKGGVGKAKVKIADLLEVEEPENATWGTIAGNITTRIKGGIGKAKIKIADLLGVEEPEDATWGTIASNITTRIKGKIGDAKIKIADLLGIENAEDATWGTIGNDISTRIKGGFKTAKIKIADLLGIEDSTDATWGTIGSKIRTGLLSGLETLKIKAADLLGIEDSTDASWGDIASKITTGLASHISKKGSFLKQLILGDEYKEGKSTWSDVGTKISGYIKEAFGEGGFLNALLGNATEQATAIAQLAGNFMTELSSWIGNNPDKISGVVSSIVESLTLAAPKFVDALTAVIRDPRLWTSLGELVKAIWKAIFGTPEENLEKNLFGGFSKEDFKQLQEYIKAYNDLQEKVAKMQELYDKGQTGTSEFKTLEKDAEAAGKKVDELYTSVSKLKGENGEGLLANYMTYAYEKGTGENGELPELPVKFAPDDEDVTTQLEEGYDSTVTLDPDDESITETMDAGYEATAELSPDDEAITDTMDTGYETTATLDPDDEPITTLLDEAEYSATVKLVPDASGMPKDTGNEPGHAKGLWDVPYDDYVARLHRNEMVLTASQAREYKEGKGTGFDIGSLTGAIVAAIRQGMAGAQVNSYINGKAITEEISRILGNGVTARRFA